LWILSARIQTPGSTGEDWKQLGNITAAMGAPARPVTPIETTPPDAIHYWVWTEP